MLNGFGDAETIERECQSLSSLGVKVAYNAADMQAVDQIENLAAACMRELGSLDIIVNNAGIQFTSAVESFPADRWDAILAINLSAPFHLIRCALPQMKAQNWGRIINIASVHGLVASVNKAAYVAAKHGLVGLTKVVALETAESGITCNAICPGWVRTPLVETQIEAIASQQAISFDEATIKLLEEKQPSKRFAEVEDLGALAVFLCSAAASSITGVSLPVDGGWTAR